MKITVNHIKRYLENLHEREEDQSVVKRKLNSIRRFVKWAHQQKQIDDKTFERIELIINDVIGTCVGVGFSDPNKNPKKEGGKTPPLRLLQWGKFDIRHYIGGVLILILMAAIGAGFYSKFFVKMATPFAYPATPTTAGRTLSFQGRLTDSLGNPIYTKTDVVFKLYNHVDSVDPANLLYTGSCTGVSGITPDQDGVFNAMIGSDCGMEEIPDSVFSENANIYLGITVGTDSEMTPRQQIANVGYAINAETLQGLPPGQNTSNIPYINQDGDLLMAALAPGIRSTFTSANFTVSSAKTLTLQSAGTGDIILNATQSGNLRFMTNNLDSLYVKNDGNVGVGTTNPLAKLDVNGTAWLRGTGTNGLFVNSNGNVGIGTTGPGTNFDVIGAGRFSTGNATLIDTQAASLFLDAGATPGNARIYGRYVLNGNSYYRNIIGIDTNYQVKIGDASAAIEGILLDSGIHTNSKIAFNVNGTEVVTFAHSGNVGIGTTSPTQKLHVAGGMRLTGALYDAGNTAGSSGQVLTSTGVGTSWASLSGLSVGNADTTDNIHLNSGINNYLVKRVDSTHWGDSGIFDNGTNIGIGTTSPSYNLHIAGAADNYLSYIYNSGTTASAAGLYVRIDGNGNLLTLNSNGTDVMTVSPTGATIGVPANFTASGDVSVAYDLLFTNQTASYIKSNASLTIEAGESFESNDLTLRTFNMGNIILESSNLWADGTNVGIGTTSPLAKLDVSGNIKIGTSASAYNALDIAAGGGAPTGNLYWGNRQLVDSSNIGSFGVSSVANNDGTLTISPTTGAVIASLNLGNANSWTGTQTFTNNTYFPGNGIWNPDGNVGIGTTSPGSE